jgi:hypothetical protein
MFAKCHKLIQHNKKLKKMWKSPSNRSFLDELLHKLVFVSASSVANSIFTNINNSMEVEDVCEIDKISSYEPVTNFHRAMSKVDPFLQLILLTQHFLHEC